MAPVHIAARLLAFAGTATAVRLRPHGEEDVAAQPAGPVYPWAGKNGDALRTGKSSSIAPKTLEAGPTWSFKSSESFDYVSKNAPFLLEKFTRFSGLIRTAPLIDNELNIYLSTVSEGTIYKFSPDGKMIWSNQRGFGTQLPGISAIMDGKLFNVASTGEAFALDMKTGVTQWTTRIASNVAGDTWSMTAADGVVIGPAPREMNDGKLSQNNKRLVAMRASDGSFMWSFDTEDDIYNVLVAVKDGSCVFSTATGKVYRLDLETGATIWETPKPESSTFTTGGSVIGPDGSTVYTTWNKVVSAGGQLALHGMVSAYSFASGQHHWTTDVVHQANNGAAVGVIGSGSNARMSVVIGLGTNPAVPDPSKGILSGKGGPELEGSVAALDATTGQIRWKRKLPSWHGAALGDDNRPDICLPDAFSNPAIGGDGTVYVGYQNGMIFSIRDNDDDGNISDSDVSTFQTGAAFQGSPGIADGMLVATSCDGMHVFRFDGKK